MSETILFRTFIVYRFPHIKEINSKPVSENDRLKARQTFQHFDKILSTPTIFSPKIDDKRHDEDKQNNAKTKREQAKKDAA